MFGSELFTRKPGATPAAFAEALKFLFATILELAAIHFKMHQKAFSKRSSAETRCDRAAINQAGAIELQSLARGG